MDVDVKVVLRLPLDFQPEPHIMQTNADRSGKVLLGTFVSRESPQLSLSCNATIAEIRIIVVKFSRSHEFPFLSRP